MSKTTKSKAKTQAGELSYLRIIAATRELIAEGDLHSLKLDAVAERSGVAKSSILWHFGSKNGLLLAVVEDVFVSVKSWILALDSQRNSGVPYLKAALEALADGFQSYPEANALLISFITNKTIDENIRQKIKILYQDYRAFIRAILTEEKVATGEYRAAAILAFIDGAYIQWYLEPETIDLKDLLLSILDLVDLH